MTKDIFAILKRHEVMAVGLLFVLLLVIFFWPAVFAGRALLPVDLIFEVDPLWRNLAPEGFLEPSNRILTDQVYQFYAWKRFTMQSLAEGVIPLWNPYMNSGQPFLANAQSAVLSPFNLISYLCPLDLSFVVVAILRLWIAGLFTFLLGRELGLSSAGALIAGLTFTFCETMVVWIGHPLSTVLALFPVLLFTTERALIRQNRLYVVAMGLVLGAQLLGGHPETFFHVTVAWLAYAIFRAVALIGWRPASLIRPGGKITAALLIGFGLAAVQLLPFVDFTLRSNIYSVRVAETKSAGLTVFNLLFNWRNWPTAITALLPRFFGSPLNNSYWYPHTNYSEQTLYVGVVPIALALVAVLCVVKNWLSKRQSADSPHTQSTAYVGSVWASRDNQRVGRFFAVFAVVTLGIALRLPMFEIVHHLPVFDLVVNERFRMVYVLAVAVLAGLGMDHVMAGLARWSDKKDVGSLRLFTVIIGFLAVISLVIILAAAVGFRFFEDQLIQQGREFMASLEGNPLYPEPLEEYYQLVEIRHQRKLALYSPQNVLMYLPVLVGLSGLALYKWLPSSLRRIQVWVSFAFLWTVIDLFAVGISFNPTVAREWIFPSVPAIEFLQQDTEAYRVVALGSVLRPNSNLVVQLPDVRGFDAIIPKRYVDLMHQIEGAYYLSPHFLFTHADSPFLDLLNVKYALVDAQEGKFSVASEDRWEQVYEDGAGIRVYQNRNVLPRAFMVYQAEFVHTSADSLTRLSDPLFNWRDTVVVEGPPPAWLSLPNTPPKAAGTASIVAYRPNEIQVEVANPVSGFLILSEIYDEGWKVRFDATTVNQMEDGFDEHRRSMKIYAADHAFRAVPLPAGEHRLTFFYEPVSYRVGRWVSLSTVGVVVILVLGYAWLERRKRRVGIEMR